MNISQTSRSRTITWEDPMPALQKGQSMSGLQFLKAMQSGELPPPPIASLMGMWITEVSEGRVVFTAETATPRVLMIHGFKRQANQLAGWRDRILGLLQTRNDPAAWELRRRTCIAHAARFSWAQYAGAMAEIYQDVLAADAMAQTPIPAVARWQAAVT